MTKISIIIPFKEYNNYLEECMAHCLQLDYDDFEIILLPDKKINKRFKKTRIIPTGPEKPSIKRNIGVQKAKGEIIAFLDSDAYPRKDWLDQAIKYFKKEEVGALGGPNLTPSQDSTSQKVTSDILSSKIACGKLADRYSLQIEQERSDLPSCNLFVRKSAFEQTNGYDPTLLTAEDIKLCTEIADLGYKIIYTPKVVVYHHRRRFLRPYLKQIFIYGRDRATFSKRYGKTNFIYTLPSIWLLFLIAGTLSSIYSPFIRKYFLGIVALYLVIILIASLTKAIKRAYLVFPGMILTHIFYGLGFIIGLFK